MSGEPKKPAKRRTPEEIQMQREAWLARKQAREAGLPINETSGRVTEARSDTDALTAAIVKAPAQESAIEDAAIEKVELSAPPSQPEAPVAEHKAKKAAAKKTVTPAKVVVKQVLEKKKAAKKKGNVFDRPANVTRREFLNLAWLGSIALLSVQTMGVSVLFLFPRFKEGEFGGIFDLPGTAATLLPDVDGAPTPFANGKFWLTNTSRGVYALFNVCTHLGCLYAWSDVTSRFECPCHGSKYELTGAYIEGPAPRSLDRFKIIATKPDGSTTETPGNGGAIKLDGDETIVVDTGVRILLPGRIEV